MSNGVQFDEDQGFDSIPRPELQPPSISHVLLKGGIVSSPGDAAFIFGVAAVALIGFSFYIIASAVPPPPELGADTPRSGEHIPDYVR